MKFNSNYESFHFDHLNSDAKSDSGSNCGADSTTKKICSGAHKMCINALVQMRKFDNVKCTGNFESGIAYWYRLRTEKARRAGLEPASMLTCPGDIVHAGSSSD